MGIVFVYECERVKIYLCMHACYYRKHFRDYTELCFKEFGDRVKHWITLNEPWSYSYGGYTIGNLAPFRCSQWQRDRNCTGGDSGTEPYLVSHHQLLSHAAAVKLYKDKYQVFDLYSRGSFLNNLVILFIWVPMFFVFCFFLNANKRYILANDIFDILMPNFFLLASNILNFEFFFLGCTSRLSSWYPSCWIRKKIKKQNTIM